tara:strand:+ start:27590 stop:28213 length:624 start_codon:yes stop_codon:yes gene_type:complete
MKQTLKLVLLSLILVSGTSFATIVPWHPLNPATHRWTPIAPGHDPLPTPIGPGHPHWTPVNPRWTPVEPGHPHWTPIRPIIKPLPSKPIPITTLGNQCPEPSTISFSSGSWNYHGTSVWQFLKPQQTVGGTPKFVGATWNIHGQRHLTCYYEVTQSGTQFMSLTGSLAITSPNTPTWSRSGNGATCHWPATQGMPTSQVCTFYNNIS